MNKVHQTLVREKIQFAANEGSLEDAFPHPAYFYVTMLRHPTDLYISAYVFSPGFGGGMGHGTISDFRVWLDTGWYGDNFMTRRLCGYSCDSVNRLRENTNKGDRLVPAVLTRAHYERALTNLRRFDVVMVLENIEGGLNKLRALRPEWQQHTSNRTAPHKNSGGKTIHQQIREHPGAMDDLKQKIHFDMLLYTAALKMSQTI